MKKCCYLINVTIIFSLILFFQSNIFGQQIIVKDDMPVKVTELKMSKADSIKKAKNIKEEALEKKLKKDEDEDQEENEMKYDSPDLFAEYQRMIRTHQGEVSPSYSVGYQNIELEKALQNRPLMKSGTLSWIDRGPGNVSGRTRGIIIDTRASDHKTWLAGSVGGGIWKTTDAGYSWANKSNAMPNLATTVLVQAASDPTIMYCGTGEGFYNADAVNGGGIFKSTDGGDSWTLLSSTANSYFHNVNRIIVDPSQANIVLAATNDGPAGIWRSTDGGSTWTRVFTGSNRVQDLIATPGNFSVQYLTVNSNGVYKSTDAGLTWTFSSKGLTAGNRYEICIAPSNTQVLYASIEIGSASGSALAVSKDGAATWSAVTTSSGTNPNWLNGQGWYDNTIAANPYTENTVFFGGINVYRADLTGTQSNTTGFLGIDLVNTSSFIQFINWGGPYNNGSIGTGLDFYNWTFNNAPFSTTQLQVSSSDYVTVEVRFGPGISQKAHRYYRSSSSLWQYKDYVTVPFQVWDVTNNRQLMVSFRDWQNDGNYDLKVWDSSQPREYIMIHAITYDANNPNPTLAQDNGVLYKMIYAIFPALANGATWTPANLPISIIRINWGAINNYFATFTQVTQWYTGTSFPYIHADQHNLTMVPINAQSNSFWIINGNDGGVTISTDGGASWRLALTGGYNTTQFYGVDKKKGSNQYFGGTQDNGTWLSPAGTSAIATTSYAQAIGGDGFDVAWNSKSTNLLIGSLYYNQFYQSTDGGYSWNSSITNLDDAGKGYAPFISKIGSCKTDPDVIYTTGISGVWKSEDFGTTWNGIPITNWSFNSLSTPIAISIAEPQNVWAGSYLTNTTSQFFVSTDGGLSFSPVNTLNQNMGSITGINTHPTDPNTAYITFSYSGYPKIFRTTNLGASWTDITAFSNGVSTNGFPNVATYCVLVMPFNTNQIWAGTEIGLVESLDGGTTWHMADNGFPNVCIWSMKIVDDQVVVATHGRGIFSVTLTQLANYNPPAVTISPILISASQATVFSNLSVKANLRSAYDSVKVFLNGISSFKQTGTSAGTATLSVPSGISGDALVQVVGYSQGRSYKSIPQTVTLTALKTQQTTYINYFTSLNSSDFTGNGFAIAKTAGFSSNSINSDHPYQANLNNTYTLLIPIKVASSNSYVEYDDVAMVEPGTPGSKYGSANFNDYVIVEASKDGKTWTALGDGYNASLNNKWSTAYYGNTTVDSTFFVHHKYNLLTSFSAGDQVLIRFRLYGSSISDGGYGWVIDNLAIQQNAVGIEKEAALPNQYALMQNYPNPFNPATTIKFSLPKSDHVKIEIFDSIGRLIETLVDTQMDAGNYSVKWNASNYASGVYIYHITAGSYVNSKKLNLMK